ncbi:MAG: phosphoribosylamine--glycine ligase [Candidatus Hinthialibacter antarcticus]|nr:phosphoribosylamine--glycine ligase [Candidatus Hinthialibacter antarcticus]
MRKKRGKNVMVVGSGGREHALLWKLNQSEAIDSFWGVPGNAGTAALARRMPMAADAVSNLASFSLIERLALVVVGPEQPLALGLADACTVEGVPVFGPTQYAARIESSKIFARNLMKKYNIPSPEFGSFDDPAAAKAYVRALAEKGKQCVVKADGLAAGKGAIVTSSPEEADAAIDQCMVEKAFGSAGAKVLIEERISGPELSIFAITDGKHMAILPPSQDHKPIGEGDTGPNTGGMGAYSPVPIATDELMKEIQDTILRPTLEGMEKEGCPYSGLLYAGIMLVDGKPYVIEFNCRFGDPETQAVLPAIDEDLYALLLASAEGKMGEDRIIPAARSTVTVVMSSGGYPGSYEKGKVIEGLDVVENEFQGRAIVFHAGTEMKDNQIVTSGGRVLAVTGLGANFDEACANAYAAVEAISFEGAYYRKDIGYRVRGG